MRQIIFHSARSSVLSGGGCMDNSNSTHFCLARSLKKNKGSSHRGCIFRILAERASFFCPKYMLYQVSGNSRCCTTVFSLLFSLFFRSSQVRGQVMIGFGVSPVSPIQWANFRRDNSRKFLSVVQTFGPFHPDPGRTLIPPGYLIPCSHPHQK